MTSHCARWPGCGCGDYVGTRCHLPDGDPRLSEKLDETKKQFADIERLKLAEEKANAWPKPRNRKERRIQAARVARAEQLAPPKDTPYKMKKKKKR